LKLRPIKLSDIELFDSFDDEEDKFIDVIHFPQTTETKTKWIESQINQRMGDKFRWIAEDANLNPVGTINTFDCERRHGTFKYAIAVGKPFRGNGFAIEMILMILRYYFFELGYQKVTVNVYSFNDASIKLHEKLGFVPEGRLRSMIYTNGKYYDEIYYGMTKQEFEKNYPDVLV
jgi:RimJ/RimL family protein N-acetyltransferase